MNSVKRILFFLLVFVFPFGQLLRIKVAQNVLVTPLDIVVFLIFLFTVIGFFRSNKIKFTVDFLTFQMLFLCVGLVSLVLNVIWHHDIKFVSSLLYLLRYAIYLSLLNFGKLIPQELNAKRPIILLGLVMVVIGFVQYFFYYDLRYLSYLGWDNHLYRLVGTFLDPNFAGVYFALFSLFLLSEAISNKLRNSYRELVLAFFTVIAVYLTYSRTALVTLVSGITTITLVKGKVKILLLGILLFVALLSVLSDISVEGLNPFRTASSIERVKSMKEAITIFSQNPVIGIGFNAYRFAMVRQGFRNEVGVAVSNADAGTDNSFLFVLATTGIVGFFFFISSYYILLKELYEEKKMIGIIPFSIVSSFLVGSFFLNVLFFPPILAFVLLIISLRKSIFNRKS